MALCKNPKCMATLAESQWGDGYCSKRCFETSAEYDPEAHDRMPHPDDRTALLAEMTNNSDLFDDMSAAHEVHPMLPRALYLWRKKHKKPSIRGLAREVGVPLQTLRDALIRFSSVAPKYRGGPTLRRYSRMDIALMDAERMTDTGNAL